jgi:hypothetical protein
LSKPQILNIKGEVIMNKNESIGCDVTECTHHSQQGGYCALDRIQVVKHGTQATSVEQTDCGSFATK